MDCLSGLSCSPDNDDRLDGDTVDAVDTPDEVAGYICCSCGRFFMFRKSRMGWELETPTVIMVAKRLKEATRIRLCQWCSEHLMTMLRLGCCTVRFLYSTVVVGSSGFIQLYS